MDREILQVFKAANLTPTVEEMIALFSQSKLNFLIGAGCSRCANLPLMEELTTKVFEELKGEGSAAKILNCIIEQYDGAEGCTIEDYMSELVDLTAIAERRQFKKSKTENVLIGQEAFTLDDLTGALQKVKQAIERIIANSNVIIQFHTQFIRAIHGRLHSGKSGMIQPINYFTLNYDTLLEDALSLERVPIADGFNGGATGWWNVNAYHNSKAAAKVFKLHGSVDWCLLEDDMLPSRVRYSLKGQKTEEPVLIWPATTKYREVQRDPFAQILEIMRRELRPDKNSEAVLAVIGYSFGDAHINYELDRALRESEGRLNVLVFTNLDKPEAILATWLKDPQIRENVRIHANNGFFHANTEIATTNSLLWWKFEVLVRLLGGER